MHNIFLILGLALIWKYSNFQVALGVLFVAVSTFIEVKIIVNKRKNRYVKNKKNRSS